VLSRVFAELVHCKKVAPTMVAVGTLIAERPPHRSRRALLTHQVHYRGEAPALADLLGQQIDAVFATLSGSIAYVRADQLRALAVMSATRSPELPKIPAMTDFVPGLEASAWSGMVAPKNTPAEIIARLNTSVNAALADPTMKARFVEIGATVFPGSPAEFGKFIANDTEKMAKVVKLAGIEVN
jgi:tripartite-type tricarboxylate transporter receptor subunit TctC